MIDLNKEINDKYTAGSFGNQVQNYQTGLGHMAAAVQSLKLLSSYAPAQDISPLLNKPINQVYKQLQGINPQAAQALVQYQVNLHNATIDWQNLLNNGHALHEQDKDVAASILTDTTPFTTAQSALNTLATSSATRMDSLNNRYQTTMSTPNEKANFPNMLSPSTVEAVRSLNDPQLMQMVAHYESGGTITGGPKGIGTKGTEVGLMLTPKPSQAGAKATADTVHQYAQVYGSNKADIVRAMKANGWQ
jgi:hypothetical protein